MYASDMLNRLKALGFLLIPITIFIILLIAIPLTVWFAGQRQDIRQRASGNTSFGMQVDLRRPEATPSNGVMTSLNPGWVRYVWTDTIDRSTLGGVNQLAIVNHETAQGAPLGSTDVNAWKSYVDTSYIPKLQSVIGNSGITAIEIWNEEDFCVTGYCPGMPAAAYGYLLKQAAATIKAQNSNMTVVMGGMGAGQAQFVTDMKNAEPTALNQVDAVAIHPYGKSPNGWSTGTLPFGDLAGSVNEFRAVSNGKPIWVTEIGQGTIDTTWQADYLSRVFQVLEAENVPVVIWYAWTDFMTGNNEELTWGLHDTNGGRKPSGNAFTAFTNPAVSTPTPSPTVGPSPTIPPPPVTDAPTPTSATSPTPTPPAATTAPTVAPFITAIPTPAPCAGCTTFAISFKIPGIGKDTLKEENNAPRQQTKAITLNFLDAKNILAGLGTGVGVYNPTTGNYDAIVSTTLVLTPGPYSLKATSPGFLLKTIVNIFMITEATTAYTISDIPTLITGDISGNNTINVEDYNALSSCFGDKKTATTQCDFSDLNSDGAVDLIDYKLFIEMFQQRGD
jgi:hypothetical protein